MSDRQPNEQELKAAAWLKVYGFPPEWWTEPERVKSIAIAIAMHTRYEGKTAEEWARLQQQTAFVVSEVNLRAEAAEVKVKELAAKLDAAIAEAKREAQPARCERHKHAAPSLNSICEICDHEEAVADAVSKRIAGLEAKLEAVEIDNIGHAHALSMLRGLFGLSIDGTFYDEIHQKHLELLEAAKLACADAAEAALQAAPDYEAMHTMVREAIMQAGNEKDKP
jgi:hypothetical protein